jgi:hypothetical protein
MNQRTVKIVVKAWNDLDSDPQEAVGKPCLLIRRTNSLDPEDVVKLFHHPYWADEQNQGHEELVAYVNKWIKNLGEEREEVFSRRAFLLVVEIWFLIAFSYACCHSGSSKQY